MNRLRRGLKKDREEMRLLEYRDVARRIAFAETLEEREHAAWLLRVFDSSGRAPSTREQMRILRKELERAFAAGVSPGL